MKAIALTQILSKGQLLPPGSELELSAKRYAQLYADGAVTSPEELDAKRKAAERQAAIDAEVAKAAEAARVEALKRIKAEEEREAHAEPPPKPAKKRST